MTMKERIAEKTIILKAKIKNYEQLLKNTNNINTVDYCKRGIETCKKSLEILGVKL